MEPKVELKLMKEIDNVTSFFDFEKVHKVMTFLNWCWSFKEDKNNPSRERIPKISEIIFGAKENLMKAGNYAYDNGEKYTVSSGGFIASAYYDKEEGEWYLDLIFGVDRAVT